MGEEDEAKSKKVVIEIPSFRDVHESSGSRPPPPDLFRPSSSFSETFSFVKNSEFYTPPPPPPPPPQTTVEPLETDSRQRLDTSSSSTLTLSSSPSSIPLSKNAILVSHRQKGNPVLKHIRNVRWSFAEIVPDYQLGQNSCALYLSVRYHLLHPDYLYYRIRELQKNYRLRVVLCHIDVEDVVKPLLEVTKTSLLHDCTLLCAWSLEECGRYLETVKIYENKPADIIQERTDTDYLSRMNHALTSIRHINKSDVVTLGSVFGSLSRVMDSSMEDLARCPGIGERKVKCLFDTFHQPFKRAVTTQSVAPLPAPSSEAVRGGDEMPSVKESEDVANEVAQANQGKDPSLTVRSVLNAAFVKYSSRISKSKGNIPGIEGHGGEAHSADTTNHTVASVEDIKE